MDLTASSTFQICSNHPEVTSGVVACARCGGMFCPDCVVELDGQPYDAVCKDEQVRDLQSGVSALPFASAGARFVGAFVDGWVAIAIYFAIAIGVSAPRGGWSALLFLALGTFVYESLMVQLVNGQTLGKMAAKTRIVSADGSPVSAGQAWARAAVRHLMSLTYVLGVVDSLMVFSKDRRTLHDRIARTRVVEASRRS
jgi:uncharacterized RDD family membrane protein YckC